MAGLLLFLLLWQVGATRFGPIVLPSPLATLTALARLFARGEVTTAAVMTTLHTLSGAGVAALAGMALGVAAGLHPLIRRGVWPVVTILQGIPPIAWIVLALIWFGSGSTTPVFTIAVATLPVVFVGTVEGVRAADPGLVEMARLYRAPPAMLFWDLYLPHLLSYLFPALVAGLGVAWKVAVMAELLATDTGIGARLATARVNLDTAAALAWILLVVLLMFTLEHLILHRLKRRLQPWRHTGHTSHTGHAGHTGHTGHAAALQGDGV